MCGTAARIHDAIKHHQFGCDILRIKLLLEHLRPGIFGIRQHDRDELRGLLIGFGDLDISAAANLAAALQEGADVHTEYRAQQKQDQDTSDATDRDTAVAEWLLKTHGVAAIPVSAFLYKDAGGPVLRFCFAKKDETLSAAADRLILV